MTKDHDEKEDTLVKFFDEDIDTENIDLAEFYASRRLGRQGGLKIKDSLDKKRKKKIEG